MRCTLLMLLVASSVSAQTPKVEEIPYVPPADAIQHKATAGVPIRLKVSGGTWALGSEFPCFFDAPADVLTFSADKPGRYVVVATANGASQRHVIVIDPPQPMPPGPNPPAPVPPTPPVPVDPLAEFKTRVTDALKSDDGTPAEKKADAAAMRKICLAVVEVAKSGDTLKELGTAVAARSRATVKGLAKTRAAISAALVAIERPDVPLADAKLAEVKAVFTAAAAILEEASK